MYARIIDGLVVETYEPPIADPATGTRFALAECFHADVVAQFVECPDGTGAGSTYDAQARTFTAPVAPAPAPVLLPQLTPMQFYLAFTPAERIAIKGSADAEVKEFWATYELAAQLNHAIDPNLVSVTAGLAYLRSAGILAADVRVDQIKAGVAQ